MRRLFALVGVVVLVDLMFFAAITPLLPWYADRFDLSKTGAGVLAGAYAAGTLVGALPSGWLATRLGSRSTMLAGLGLLAVASVTFAFGRSIAVLDLSRFVQGLGGACTWAGAFGWLVSMTPPAARGRAIGKLLSAGLFGLLLGPALGALAREVGPEGPFAAIGVLALALAAVALRLPGPPVTVTADRPLARALGDGTIRLVIWLVMLPALVFGAVEVLAPLELDRLGATSVAIAATFVIAAGLEAVAQVLTGRATDRYGRLWPLRIGFAGVVAFMLLMPLPRAALALAVVVTVGCVVTGAINTPAMALLADAVEAARLDQGFGFALSNLTWAGGQVLGSIGGGALAALAGDTVVYLALAAIGALALASLARTRRWVTAEPERVPVA